MHDSDPSSLSLKKSMQPMGKASLFGLLLLGLSCISLLGESNEQALMKAIRAGDIQAATKAIGEGAWIDWLDLEESTTPLVAAVEAGDLPMVERLIESGADVRFRTPDNRSPLEIAVANGHGSIVRKLVASGATAGDLGKKDGFTLMQRAIRDRHLDIAQMLLEARLVDVNQRDEIGNTLPMMAANAIHEKHRYLEPLIVAFAELAESRGLPWNAENLDRQNLADTAAAFQLPALLEFADRDQRYKALLKTLQKFPPEYHIAQAVENGDLDALEWLLEKHDADWQLIRRMTGYDLAARATQLNRADIAILLMQHGNPLDGVDRNGEGIFTLAARTGVHRVVLALLARGMPPDAIDSGGGSGLHGACLAGRLDYVRMFVEQRGANVNQVAAGGVTPLIAAAYANNLDLVRYLLARGANPRLRDEQARAAIDIAAARQEIGMVRELARPGQYEELLKSFVPRPESPFIGYWSNGVEGFEHFALDLQRDGSGTATIGFGVRQSLYWKAGPNFTGEVLVSGQQGVETYPLVYEVGPNRVLLTNPAGQQIALSRTYAPADAQSPHTNALETPGYLALEAWKKERRPAEGPKLSGLGLKQIPPMLFLEPNVERLDISSNHLESISESINQLSGLRELRANQNAIWSLPMGLMRLRNLERVELQQNQLQFLPIDFGGWSSVEYVDLSDNLLRQLPDGISRLESMEELRLRNNRLIGLPNGVAGWRKLVELDLSHNALRDLPPTLDQCDRLEKLMLMSNHLKEFPEVITGLQRLETLSLRNNRIEELPETLSKLRRLQVLDLAYNRLQRLPLAMKDLRELRAIDLRGNPDLQWADVAELQRVLPKAVVAFDESIKPVKPTPTPDPSGLPPREIVIDVSE